MLPLQILQNVINGSKNITRRELSIIEPDGKIIATTKDEMPVSDVDISNFMSSEAESQLVRGCHYFKVFDDKIPEYILRIDGEDDESYRIGKLMAFTIQMLVISYKERYDKDNFIKNLLLDNMLLVDIANRANKLHIESNVYRTVFIIDVNPDKLSEVLEIVNNIYPAKGKDFVTAIDESIIVLVKELSDKDAYDEIDSIAEMVYDTLATEALSNVYIASGTIVSDLKSISGSCKEARMAMEVGKIFEPDKHVVSYERLGIGRLIYQLPVSLCKMFVNEVMHGIPMSNFDNETLVTINKFFENNLNVSETSRKLYIHRNTLVYRLDKLQKSTGLDLRNFDVAIIFKIALMVSKYMTYKEKNAY